MRLGTGFVLACALAASTAWAQDVTGKWTATAVGNNVAVTLDLKIAGNVVTGAILNPQSGPAEIFGRQDRWQQHFLPRRAHCEQRDHEDPLARQDRGRRDPLHTQRRRRAGPRHASHREASAIVIEPRRAMRRSAELEWRGST